MSRMPGRLGAIPLSTALRLVWFAAAWLLALVLVGAAVLADPGLSDARNYWQAWHVPLYESGFVYPPAGALVFLPAVVLPWEAFAALFVATSFLALAWLLAPVPLRLRVPIFLTFAATVAWGNVAVLLAVPLAMAPRHPMAWVILAWTKVGPAIGIVSLVALRRWRPLLVAVGACAAVGLATLALVPAALATWISDFSGRPDLALWQVAGLRLHLPIALRLPLGAAIAWLGASRPWTLAIAAIVTTPDLSLATVGLLAAAPRLGTSGAARAGTDAT